MDLLLLQTYAAQTAAFVAMGVIAALLPAEAHEFPHGQHFRWLAAFALIRGGLGFIELWTLEPIPQWWTEALLAASFVCLFEFTRRLFRDVGRRTSTDWSQYTSLAVFIPIIGGTLLVPVLATDRLAAYEAAIRYLIALPGGVGAAIALHFTMRGKTMARVDRWMTYALSAGFATYGLLAGLFVDPGAGFPAWLPTSDTALDVTGLPVALFRAAAIAVASLCLGALVYRASHRAALQLRRQTQELEALTVSLESRVAERTAALRGQEAFAQQLINGTPAIILLLSPEGRIEHVNPAFERLTGWPLQEVRGKDWLTLLPRRDVSRIGRLLQVAIAGTPTQGNVNPILTRTGEEREIEWYDQVLRDGSGTVTGLVAVGIDVTDRKRTEEALRESEARLRAIVESEPECVKIVGRDGTLLDMNPAGLHMIGASTLESVRNLQVTDLVDPRYHARYREAIEAVFRGETSEDEYEIVALDGSRHWMEQHAVPMREPSDPACVTAMLAVTRDITARRQMAEELRRSEQRLRQAQTIAVIGNWELDLGSGKLWWSDEIYHIFEVDQTQFAASYEAFLGAIHPGDRKVVDAAYTASLQTREPYQITHRILTAGGRVKHVEERCETDFAADGTPLSSRGTVQDVTLKVEAELALQATIREKETLLREVHHRVKNNLQIISSLLYFQVKRVQHPADLAAFADVRSRLRAMSLVHERLYRSRDLSTIDMRDYLKELIAALRQSHGDASQGINIAFTADRIHLPVESAMPVGMIVNELLTNVFKHAFPTDYGDRRAEIRMTLSGSQGEISVGDNGVGLPETFSPESGESFGWHSIVALTAQLDGQVRIAEGAGTRIVIAFPTGERV